MSRAQLISSAVSFLRDPSTAASPLAQRIGFLESKGLTPQEIEQALAQANGSTSSAMMGRMGGPQLQQEMMMNARREYERDWRDWFIMAVVGGTVGYVAAKLAQKFVVPHLQPPSESELEAAQKALEAKYDEAAEMLVTLQKSTDSLSQSLDEQKAAVEKELDEVRKAVEEMREGEKRREEWSKKVGDQVDEVVRGLPGLLEKQASSSAQSLTDLQTELKSLKSLLIARRPTPSSVASPTASPSISAPIANVSSSTSTSVPTSLPTEPLTTETPSIRASSPFGVRKPGIPSWQRSGASSATLAAGASSTEAGASGDQDKVTEDTSASGVLVQKEDAVAGGSSTNEETEASSSTGEPGSSGNKVTIEDVKE